MKALDKNRAISDADGNPGSRLWNPIYPFTTESLLVDFWILEHSRLVLARRLIGKGPSRIRIEDVEDKLCGGKGNEQTFIYNSIVDHLPDHDERPGAGATASRART